MLKIGDKVFFGELKVLIRDQNTGNLQRENCPMATK